MPETITDSPISLPIVHLMKGVLYSDSNTEQWILLLRHLGPIQDYFKIMGLEVILDEAEGYAFLRQMDAESEEQGFPRLIQRRPLSFHLSLLCVLLRKKLAEQEVSGGENRLILKREQIIELIRVFLQESSNEAKMFDQVDAHIKRLVDFGLLRRLKNDEEVYEVRRVVKALVDAEWLRQMSEKLEGYRKHVRNTL